MNLITLKWVTNKFEIFAVDIQMKRTKANWGSYNIQKRKYIPINIITQPLLILSFLIPGYRSPLMICNSNSVCEGRVIHIQTHLQNN